MTDDEGETPPIPPRIPRLRKRSGRCYELALRGLQLDNDQPWLLVHGEVDMGPSGPRMGHAWLRLGEWVYDPVLDDMFTVNCYSDWLNAVVFVELLPEDAAECVIKYKNWGPWA